MGGLRGINDFPVVFLEQAALIIRQAALRVVQNQARANWRERRIDVDRIGIAGKVHSVHAMIGEMAAQPLNALFVGRKSVLCDQILAKPQDIRGVEQGFFLGCLLYTSPSPRDA